jgi:hypothetical protein
MKRNRTRCLGDHPFGSFKEAYGSQRTVHPACRDTVVAIVRAYMMQVMVLSRQEQTGVLQALNQPGRVLHVRPGVDLVGKSAAEREG